MHGPCECRVRQRGGTVMAARCIEAMARCCSRWCSCLAMMVCWLYAMRVEDSGCVCRIGGARMTVAASASYIGLRSLQRWWGLVVVVCCWLCVAVRCRCCDTGSTANYAHLIRSISTLHVSLINPIPHITYSISSVCSATALNLIHLHNPTPAPLLSTQCWSEASQTVAAGQSALNVNDWPMVRRL